MIPLAFAFCKTAYKYQNHTKNMQLFKLYPLLWSSLSLVIVKDKLFTKRQTFGESVTKLIHKTALHHSHLHTQ